MVGTTYVFANRHARAGGDARPYNSIGTGAEFAAERIVTHDMMARRVSLYIRYPPSHGRGVEDAAPYGWAVDPPFSSHPAPSRMAAQWRSGDGAPYGGGQ